MWLKLPKQNTDQDIFQGLQLGHPQCQVWENKLYIKFRYFIRDAIWKHKISEEAASMAYSDALLATIQKIQAGSFEQRSSLKTFVYRVFQYKCIDQIRKEQSSKQDAPPPESLDAYLETLPDEQQDMVGRLCVKYEVAALTKRIQLMDDRCRKIILAWGEGYHDREIAEDLGYQSAAVAKTSRLRCLEKLKKTYQESRGLISSTDG